MNEFKLKAPYEPTGDQPQAIAGAGERISRKEISVRHCSVLRVPVKHLRWRM